MRGVLVRLTRMAGCLVALPATAAAGLVAMVQYAAAEEQGSVDFTVHETFPVTSGKMVRSDINGCKSATVKTIRASRSESNGVSTSTGNKRIDCGSGNSITLGYSAKSSACLTTDSGTWKATKGTGIFAAAKGQGELVGTFTLGKGPGTFCNSDGIDDRYTGKLQF